MENLPQEQRKQRLIQSKPSEKGEIITYLSRMGDVLEQIFERHEIIALCIFRVHIVIDCNVSDAEHRKALLNIETGMKLISAKAAEVFLCQVGTKKILRIYKPFIGGQPPVNDLRFLYALLPFFVRRFLYAVSNASIIGVLS